MEIIVQIEAVNSSHLGDDYVTVNGEVVGSPAFACHWVEGTLPVSKLDELFGVGDHESHEGERVHILAHEGTDTLGWEYYSNVAAQAGLPIVVDSITRVL